MSEIIGIETQGIASPLAGLTMVAVLCKAPDGYRVYHAAHVLRLAAWADDKAVAVAWTKSYGNKMTPGEAARYFNIPAEWRFAP